MDKSTAQLPQGYGEIFKLDLQKNKKTALIVNGIATLIILIMIPLGAVLSPASLVFNFGSPSYVFIRFGVLLAGVVVYMILHELVHGIVMKAFGAEKIKYGFTGLYAFAGSDTYFSKAPYLMIALAPVIVWGAVLAVVNIFVPSDWFWVVYFIQISNISGAAGDMYVTFKFISLPDDILVRDTGTAMTVYSAESPE